MESELVERIRQKVGDLNPEEQEKVLEFVESLASVTHTPWQIWQEHLKEIPQEELDEIPTDGSHNLDHYLYRSPKK